MEMTMNNYETTINRTANLKAFALAMITIISVLVASYCTVFCLENFVREERTWTQEERVEAVNEMKTTARNTAAYVVYRMAGRDAAMAILDGPSDSPKEIAKTIYSSYMRTAAKKNPVMGSIVSTMESFSVI